MSSSTIGIEPEIFTPATLTSSSLKASGATLSILVVDDDLAMRSALEALYRRQGWRVQSATGMTDAVARFRGGDHRLVLTDMRMPDGDGLAVIRELRRRDPGVAVLMLTAYPSVPDAVLAMRGGALEYLAKPVSFPHLEQVSRRLIQESSPRPCHLDSTSEAKGEIIGQSVALRRTLDLARQVAGSAADILIEAESGTGKELLARMIHRLSPRREGPFVAVNCAAFPETLLESELFGHAKGAFTGAAAAHEGKFEQANGGVLLLDEVGEMPLNLQPKLLRVLQERELDRLGGTRTIRLDLRVIATTNRSLLQMVRAGQFRADLYYRLNVIPLSLPPLRERPEDIAELAQHFMRRHAASNFSTQLTPDFLAALQRCAWPGNVRELANIMQRVAVLGVAAAGLPQAHLSPSDDAVANSLATNLFRSPSPLFNENEGENEHDVPPSAWLKPGVSMESAERRLLEMTLDATGGNRSRAAQLLGISLRTVRNRIREYGLPPRKDYGIVPQSIAPCGGSLTPAG